MESICSRQNRCERKIEICVGKCGNHCWKMRKWWLPAFSPFPTMFSKECFLKDVKSWDSVVNCVKHILFNPFPKKPWFVRVCSTSLLKTLWEKEKLLVTSNFSFSHSVFYPFGELSAILIKFDIVVCKLIEFGRV